MSAILCKIERKPLTLFNICLLSSEPALCVKDNTTLFNNYMWFMYPIRLNFISGLCLSLSDKCLKFHNDSQN